MESYLHRQGSSNLPTGTNLGPLAKLVNAPDKILNLAVAQLVSAGCLYHQGCRFKSYQQDYEKGPLNFNSMMLLFLFLTYCIQLCALVNLAEYNIPDWIKFCAFIPIIGLIAEIIAVLFYRN